MGIKGFFSRIFAKKVVSGINMWRNNPIQSQHRLLQDLIENAKNTKFGIDHDFKSINTIEDFQKRVPIGDYEILRPYIDLILEGNTDILWPGLPLYFAKTSGTTSGAKLIPITKESIKTHANGAKMALLSYINETGKTKFVNGKMIFLQGSPVLNKSNGILTGRLSGISAHLVPKYLQKNRLPSYETNCIEDWEKKVDAIVEETVGKNMSLISGIPSWVIMYFEKLIEFTKKKNIKSIFPEFNLFVFGGVAFDPYKERLLQLIGKDIDKIELYPASEGFIAFQDKQNTEGLLLNLGAEIFYEFIPANQYFDDDRERLALEQVKLGVNYAIILNTSAGLWGYDIGDTVEFTSLNPYRIKVSGRIKHYTSAFGEHVIGSEVEKVMLEALGEHNSEINEFHVAPMINPESGLPYHEWIIEFSKPPKDKERFALKIDELMCKTNIYYKDLIEGKILRNAVVTSLKTNSFNNYMESIGKLGGQNKVPRLANDRKIADILTK
jgi:hypothetical protein